MTQYGITPSKGVQDTNYFSLTTFQNVLVLDLNKWTKICLKVDFPKFVPTDLAFILMSSLDLGGLCLHIYIFFAPRMNPLNCSICMFEASFFFFCLLRSVVDPNTDFLFQLSHCSISQCCPFYNLYLFIEILVLFTHYFLTSFTSLPTFSCF